jgi:hypothetical protein
VLPNKNLRDTFLTNKLLRQRVFIKIKKIICSALIVTTFDRFLKTRSC